MFTLRLEKFAVGAQTGIQTEKLTANIKTRLMILVSNLFPPM